MAVKKARNTIIFPHGGMSKRGGLRTMATVPKGSRIESFEFSDTQRYVLCFSTDGIRVFKPDDNTLLKHTNWTKTQEVISTMDIIQSADTVIITHKDHKPQSYKRAGSDTSWNLEDITFSNIPKYDYGGGKENVWSDTRGYPATCTFHQGRLFFGGVKSKPTSVFGSVLNDFFNFNDGGDEIKATHGIFDTIDTDQYNEINNIVSAKSLMCFTVSGEFANKEPAITPFASSWARYTGYGSKRIKPVNLDGSVFIVDKYGKSIRTMIFSLEEDGYKTPPVSMLSEHLINDVVDIGIVRGSSSSISNLLFVINGDGTMAILNTMREENINGWTGCDTQGKFTGVAVTSGVVSFLVERGENTFIEMLDESIFLDHIFSSENSNTIEIDKFLYDNEIEVVGNKIRLSAFRKYEDSGRYYVETKHTYEQLYCGLSYKVEIETLPILTEDQDGGISSFRKTRIISTSLQILNSSGIAINGELIQSRSFGDSFNMAPDEYTGVKKIRHLGYGELNTIKITQETPTPFTILAILTEIAV